MEIKFSTFIVFNKNRVSMIKEVEWPCLPNKGDWIFVDDELVLEINSIIHEVKNNEISILLKEIRLHHEGDYEDMINKLGKLGWKKYLEIIK